MPTHIQTRVRETKTNQSNVTLARCLSRWKAKLGRYRNLRYLQSSFTWWQQWRPGQGAVPGVWCLPALPRKGKGTEQPKGWAVHNSGDQSGFWGASTELLCSCPITSLSLFLSITSGNQPGSNIGGRFDKCSNYHQTPHPKSKKIKAIYLST